MLVCPSDLLPFPSVDVVILIYEFDSAKRLIDSNINDKLHNINLYVKGFIFKRIIDRR